MKLTFDISATEFVTVRDILADIVPPGCRVWVFGSRAKNQVRFNSDLDLSLECKDKLPPIILHKLKEAFSDSPLPYRVDVLDINDVSENFQTIIRQQAVAFPLAKTDKVPKLRFKDAQGNDFPDWEVNRLGQLGDFRSGVEFAESEQGGQNGTPFYKVSDMNLLGNETCMTVANNYVTDEQINRLRYKPVMQNSIIFAKVGAAVFLERKRRANDFLFDNNMMAFIANHQIDPSYSSVLFANIRLSKLAQAGALPSYNGSDLATIKVVIPPLPEQQKIASFLSSVDTKIDQLTKKKAILEQYKKGVMQKLFSQELRFKDAQGNDFPDWEVNRLGQLGDFRSGVEFAESEQGGQNGTPFYKVSDMNLLGNETCMTVANNYVTDEQINRLRYKPIMQNSIIFAKVGAAVFLERKRRANDFLFDNNMMAFIANHQIDPSYSSVLFANIRLSKLAQAGALPSYNGSDLATIKVVIPPLPEQQKIASFLSSVDTKIDQLTKKKAIMEQYKKGLLQQMFV